MTIENYVTLNENVSKKKRRESAVFRREIVVFDSVLQMNRVMRPKVSIWGEKFTIDHNGICRTNEYVALPLIIHRIGYNPKMLLPLWTFNACNVLQKKARFVIHKRSTYKIYASNGDVFSLVHLFYLFVFNLLCVQRLKLYCMVVKWNGTHKTKTIRVHLL